MVGETRAVESVEPIVRLQLCAIHHRRGRIPIQPEREKCSLAELRFVLFIRRRIGPLAVKKHQYILILDCQTARRVKSCRRWDIPEAGRTYWAVQSKCRTEFRQSQPPDVVCRGKRFLPLCNSDVVRAPSASDLRCEYSRPRNSHATMPIGAKTVWRPSATLVLCPSDILQRNLTGMSRTN